MFYSLHGVLSFIGKNFVSIDCGSVGYMVFVSLGTKQKLLPIGSKTFLYTYVHYTEKTVDIYGFLTTEERECFLLLLPVSGVGPKLCLSFLSSISPIEIIEAISSKNTKILTKASGVSEKLALRVVTELEKKAKKLLLSFGPRNLTDKNSKLNNIEIFKAVEALVALGYQKDKAYEVAKSFKNKMPVEEIIKYSLRLM